MVVVLGGVVVVAGGVVVFFPPQPVKIIVATITTVKIRKIHFFIDSFLPPLLLPVDKLFLCLISHRFTSSHIGVFKFNNNSFIYVVLPTGNL